MSKEFDEIQATFTDSINLLLNTRNVIYNSAFNGGSSVLDRTGYFKSVSFTHFFGFPFSALNVNGLFLHKVAFFYSPDYNSYPFNGDL